MAKKSFQSKTPTRKAAAGSKLVREAASRLITTKDVNPYVMSPKMAREVAKRAGILTRTGKISSFLR